MKIANSWGTSDKGNGKSRALEAQISIFEANIPWNSKEVTHDDNMDLISSDKVDWKSLANNIVHPTLEKEALNLLEKVSKMTININEWVCPAIFWDKFN